MNTKSKKKFIFIALGLLIFVLALSPWFNDDLISSHARSFISQEIQDEGLIGNKVVDGELICDGLCVDRYPFFTKVGVQDAEWIIPFWGSVYRVK